MADVNKIQLPDNSVINIKDYRIPGVDSTPTMGSDNVVTSGGVAGALAGKQDTIDASHKLDYSLLSNTPTIPAAQVNSDWNASSGVAQILNKPDLTGFITKTVNDLTNYYKKTETYTQTEINNLIGAIQQFRYEIVASTSAVTEPASNVLYLIGPTGSGADKYEEYVYANSTWTKIGDTSIDLSGYVTTTALNTALADYALSSTIPTALSDLTDDSTHRTVTDTEKEQWMPRIYIGTCGTAAATVNKVVTVESFPVDGNGKPLVGTMIGVKFTNTNSATAPKLNVNETGAASIWYNNDAASSTSSAYGGSAARYAYYVWDGTYWVWVTHGTDNNDNTLAYNVRYNSASKTAIDGFRRYRILFTSADDAHWVPATTSTSTNATASRTVNQTPINPFGQIVYYGSTTTVSEDGTPGATVLYTQYNVTLGYSFNRTGAALTLTTKTPVYIKCAPQSNGSAIIDADTPYVQSLPSTEDGKIYIYLGVASSATAVEMSIVHPVYYYKDGLVRPWTNAAVVSITVDQTYDGTSTNAQSGVAVAGALTGKQDTIDASHKLDYSLLSNTPTIPAAQVNSDWNASSGVAQILNKPTIPPNKTLVLTDFPEDGIGCYWLDPDWTYCSWDELSDAFNGKYEAVYIHIAAYYDEDTQEYRKERYITTPIRLSSDYYEVGSSYIEFDIRGEVIPDIFTCCIELGPTSYIQVSYRRAVPPLSTNIEQDKTHNDMTATPNAVYNAIHPAVQTTQPQGGFLPNVEYNLGTLTGSVTFALASAVSGIGNKWYWCFKAGATAPTITWPSGLLWPQPDAEPPTIEAGDEVEVEVKNGHIVALVFKPTS